MYSFVAATGEVVQQEFYSGVTNVTASASGIYYDGAYSTWGRDSYRDSPKLGALITNKTGFASGTTISCTMSTSSRGNYSPFVILYDESRSYDEIWSHVGQHSLKNCSYDKMYTITKGTYNSKTGKYDAWKFGWTYLTSAYRPTNNTPYTLTGTLSTDTYAIFVGCAVLDDDSSATNASLPLTISALNIGGVQLIG